MVPIDFSYTTYDFLQALNSNFCSRTHRLATIHTVTDDEKQQTQQCSISARLKILDLPHKDYLLTYYYSACKRGVLHANVNLQGGPKSKPQIFVHIFVKYSDVVLETKVLVSRRLEDKNTSLGLGLGLEIKVLVLILVLTKKS